MNTKGKWYLIYTVEMYDEQGPGSHPEEIKVPLQSTDMETAISEAQLKWGERLKSFEAIKETRAPSSLDTKPNPRVTWELPL
jgi:hypothetical protein